MTEILIHVRHLRAAGMCNREPRLWFARHGLSWTEFVTTGILESRILATNDSLCLPVVETARREAEDVALIAREAELFDRNIESYLDDFEEAMRYGRR